MNCNASRAQEAQLLAKAIVQEYLSENHFYRALRTFVSEDQRREESLSKSAMLTLLSLKGAYAANRASSQPFRSVLEVMVATLQAKEDRQTSKGHTQESKHGRENESRGDSIDFMGRKSGGTNSFKSSAKAKNLHRIYGKLKEIDKIALAEKEKRREAPVQIPLLVGTGSSFSKKNISTGVIYRPHVLAPDGKVEKISPSSLIRSNQNEHVINLASQAIKIERTHEIKSIKEQSSMFVKQSREGKEKPVQQNGRQKKEEKLLQVLEVKLRGVKRQEMKREVGEVIQRQGKKERKQENPNAVSDKSEKLIEKEVEAYLDSLKPVIKEQVKQTQNEQVKQTQKEQVKQTQKEQVKQTQKEQVKQTQQELVKPAVVMKRLTRKPKQAFEGEYQCKFKFQDKFDPIIAKPVYLYEPFRYLPFTLSKDIRNNPIIIDVAIDYQQYSSSFKPSLQRKERGISTIQAEDLRRIVFQSQSPYLPKAWHQGFILSNSEDTFYGLQQLEGGPCGIIASVQCYFLKHLFLCGRPEQQGDMKKIIRREICLVAAMVDMLMKIGKGKFVLAFPTAGFAGVKLNIASLSVIAFEAVSFQKSFEFVWSYRNRFIGTDNFGVTSLMYSAVLSKSPNSIESQVDCRQNPLIGQHGHCTQQLVNLFLTGTASSNCFDGIRDLESCQLRGIQKLSEFGFLTVFQALGYIEVGNNLKSPLIPIWVICKQFHYHVVFANNHLISLDPKASMFDLIYYDGLYNPKDCIRLTLSPLEEEEVVSKELQPLIEKVLATKWGQRKVNWNGSIKIL